MGWKRKWISTDGCWKQVGVEALTPGIRVHPTTAISNEFKQETKAASAVSEHDVRRTKRVGAALRWGHPDPPQSSTDHDETIIALPRSSRRSLFKPQAVPSFNVSAVPPRCTLWRRRQREFFFFRAGFTRDLMAAKTIGRLAPCVVKQPYTEIPMIWLKYKMFIQICRCVWLLCVTAGETLLSYEACSCVLFASFGIL